MRKIENFFLFSLLIVLFLIPGWTWGKAAWEYRNEGWEYYNSGDYDKALESFEQAVGTDGDGWSYYGAGVTAYYGLADYEEAESYLTTAVELLPDEVYPLLNLAWLYRSQNEHLLSKQAFEDLIELSPTNAQAYYGAALACQNLENYSQAVTYYEQCVERNPDYTDAYNNWGWMLYNLEEYEDALEPFREYIATGDSDGWGSYGGGICLQNLGEYEEAVDLLIQAEPLLPEGSTGLPSAFLCYYYIGNGAKVELYADKNIAYYGDSGELMPSWIPSSAGAYFLYQTDEIDNDLAIEYYNIIVEGDYTQEEIDDAKENMAYAYYNKGELAMALSLVRHNESNWIFQRLCPKKVTLHFDMPLKTAMNYYYNSEYYGPGEYYFALPIICDYQELVSVEAGEGFEGVITNGRMRYAAFNFEDGIPDEFEMTVEFIHWVTNLAPERLQTVKDDGTELGYFANHFTEEYDGDNRQLSTLLDSIVEGKRTALEKAMAVHEWVSTNCTHIYYIEEIDNDDPGSWPVYENISEMLETKIGHCYHFSVLYSSMMRALGIPARVIGGYVFNYFSRGLSGAIEGHYTVELYDPDREEWFYIEPQDSTFFGANASIHAVVWEDREESPPENYMSLQEIVNVCQFYLDETGCEYEIEFIN